MIDLKPLPTRLVVAAVLIVLALSIFAVIQHFSETAVEAPKPAMPQPALPHPSNSVLPPPVLPAPHSNPGMAQPAAASSVKAVPPLAEVPPEILPPPSVSSEPPHLAKALAERKGRHARKAAYMLQFGVFSSESNRSRMLASLKRKGLHPVTNTRVLLGPYPDRESAEKERKTLGMASVLVILPGKYLVQVGDFESIGHAMRLAENLGKRGLSVRLESRIRAGHYESRRAAMEAAGKMGISAIPVRP